MLALMLTISAFALAADYLKTLTEKYVRLPKLLDFLFRFFVDSVATVTARSGIDSIRSQLNPLKWWVDKCIYSRGTIARPDTRISIVMNV
jgi:hypothetical protein